MRSPTHAGVIGVIGFPAQSAAARRYAPTLVMTSAREFVRERYGENGGPGKAMFHPPRSFSEGTARELLAFLVRANMAALTVDLA